MRLYDFCSTYPNEAVCKAKFLQIRQAQGVVCPICGGTEHYWCASHNQFECKHCHHRQSLRSGTVLHGSHLPYRYWFIAMHLLTSTKHTFSALELQRQIGHKRYQPIWEMVHKLRTVMGERDAEYFLTYSVELDEAFFTTTTPKEKKGEKLSVGSGSERKAKVLVMAESIPIEEPKKGKKAKKVGHIKMLVVPDLKKETLTSFADTSLHPKTFVTMDASHAHSDIEKKFQSHVEKLLTQQEIDKVLPWVHTVIANAKMQLADTYHGTKTEFLQDYLNEFCYKFNRRYFGEGLFDRLLEISASYMNHFEHRVYNRNLCVA